MAKQIVSGVLLLDKPSGISSHSALAQAKRLFMSSDSDSKKAGHTGTLDPMATGLLPICLGDATKFSSFGLDADKGYTAIIKLGEQTDTGDKEGQIIAQKNVPTFDEQGLDELACDLLGEQQQTPPMYSALKKDGKKLYEYARDGIEIERAPRPIVIHHLALNKLSDNEIALDVICSKGTYVRVLGETVAERLGTVGHLTALHRTSTGGFDVAGAISLDDLANLSFDERFGKLLSVDVLLNHLPIIKLTTDETARIKMGQRLNIKDRLDDASFTDETVQIRLYHDDEFVGLGQVAMSGRLQPIRLVA
ncbi:tRNA pseudouridine(55) synthase TruB [Moraxella bovis]|uniref:tRNA pseudouridine(55) synthase TruB n=1 Tax=Moraxella bovis TaxID=476 RepID=UPI002226BB0D|nr:tRNA pseudouridine(55) synthase TruB [Moraxella bovis]UYZ68413.1 tRNA pseudouridine(55) synthase TruB [Moraxella bovis]UYZ70786.1 tRNA pseudouridine(55) synthase TruB [Moraxella bovis]UYZ73282.1 tRNA pseudouridine(55) synthase TruB [Moraxella bovis]UZA14094.1 tRNA pseudouridine(55) synthase TruB [Moraxella bovis]UZA27553.1 tRNA pseudouridine(55) synthase TruB [Moraxella bovis]